MYRKRKLEGAKPGTAIGVELLRLMNARNPKMSIRELSDSLKITYEYARRLVRGLSIPGKFAIPAIANLLDANPQALESIAHRDRLRKAGVLETVVEVNQDQILFQKALDKLDHSEREQIRKQMRGIIDSA